MLWRHMLIVRYNSKSFYIYISEWSVERDKYKIPQAERDVSRRNFDRCGANNGERGTNRTFVFLVVEGRPATSNRSFVGGAAVSNLRRIDSSKGHGLSVNGTE